MATLNKDINTTPNVSPNQANLPQVNAPGVPLGVDPMLWSQFINGQNPNYIPPPGAAGGLGIGSVGGLGGLGGNLRAGGFGSGISQSPSFDGRLSPSQNQWLGFMQQGRDAVAGINRMPFMFNNYGGVPTDPKAAIQQFYPSVAFNGMPATNLGLPQAGTDSTGPFGIDFSQFHFPDAARAKAATIDKNTDPQAALKQLQAADQAMLMTAVGSQPTA